MKMRRLVFRINLEGGVELLFRVGVLSALGQERAHFIVARSAPRIQYQGFFHFCNGLWRFVLGAQRTRQSAMDFRLIRREFGCLAQLHDRLIERTLRSQSLTEVEMSGKKIGLQSHDNSKVRCSTVVVASLKEHLTER